MEYEDNGDQEFARYIQEDIGETGYDPNIEGYDDYDPNLGSDSDDEEEEENSGTFNNEYDGQYDDSEGFGGHEYGFEDEDDDEEDDEDSDEDENNKDEDGESEDEDENDKNSDGKNKKRIKAGEISQEAESSSSQSKKNDDKPVDFAYLQKFWSKMVEHSATRELCKSINSTVRESIGAATAGFAYLLTVVKPKYLTNTIGALLDLIDAPMGSILFDPKELVNFVLRFPPIQALLKKLRSIAEPVMQKPSGALPNKA